MRIAVDGREIEGHPTGVGRVVMGLLRAWPDIDQLEVVTRRAPAIDLPRGCGLTVAPGPRWMPGSAWEQIILPAVIRRQGVDALLAPGYGMPWRTRIPTAVCMHDCAPFALPGDFGLRERLRRRSSARLAARRAAFLFMGSHFAAAEARRYLGISDERLLVVPWGLDRAFLEPPVDPNAVIHRYAVGDRSVLFVGSGFRRRGLQMLARAVAELAADRPGVELLVAGPEPPAMIRELPGVRALGFVPEADLPALYAAATVVAYPSEYEGFGLPVLEALACGVPVVASATTALVEVYTGRAVLVPHEDSRAWKAALARILDDPEERTRQVERGRGWARRQGWETTAGRVRTRLAATGSGR